MNVEYTKLLLSGMINNKSFELSVDGELVKLKRDETMTAQERTELQSICETHLTPLGRDFPAEDDIEGF